MGSSPGSPEGHFFIPQPLSGVQRGRRTSGLRASHSSPAAHDETPDTLHLTPLGRPPAPGSSPGSSPGSYKGRVVGPVSSTAGPTSVRGPWQTGGPPVSPPRSSRSPATPRSQRAGELPPSPRRPPPRRARAPRPRDRMEPRLAPRAPARALLLCLGKPPRRQDTRAAALRSSFDNRGVSTGSGAPLERMSLACQSVSLSGPGGGGSA